MVEEHVGKKRRKEVRQAITMSDELRKSLTFIFGVLGGSLVVLLLLTAGSMTGIIPISTLVSNTVPLIVVLIAIIVVAPRANRYWALRDEYKSHLQRYNISKDDMNALKRGELS